MAEIKFGRERPSRFGPGGRFGFVGGAEAMGKEQEREGRDERGVRSKGAPTRSAQASSGMAGFAPGVDAVEAARWLRAATQELDPDGAVAHVYRPLEYAWEPHRAYLERYGATAKRALLVGMNPGPWGMGQTGIPFGDVALAGDWLGLAGTRIAQPARTHPKRPVQGWACTRREASGRRLWGRLRDLFGSAEAALADLLVVNHCPLLMFTAEGRNVTPETLPKRPREEILAVCDEGLARMVAALRPVALIGVGRYAERRAAAVAATAEREVEVLAVPHPSPASPIANQDGGSHWRAAFDAGLQAVSVLPIASSQRR